MPLSIRFTQKLGFVVMGLAFLSNCTADLSSLTLSKNAVASEAQACAIGYDLAQQIYKTVSLRETIIIAPKRQTECERWSLQYLKLAGFAIDETQKAETFDVTLTPAEGTNIAAVATIGAGLKIARVYKPGDAGVYPITDVSILALSPEFGG